MFISCLFGIFMGKCIYVIFGINKFSLHMSSCPFTNPFISGNVGVYCWELVVCIATFLKQPAVSCCTRTVFSPLAEKQLQENSFGSDSREGRSWPLLCCNCTMLLGIFFFFKKANSLQEERIMKLVICGLSLRIVSVECVLACKGPVCL